MIKKINLGVIIIAVYFLGLVSGLQIQNVKAVVRAPNDNNQPVTSNGKAQPVTTSQPAANSKPVSNSQPVATKKAEPKPQAASKPAKTNKPVAQATQPQNAVVSKGTPAATASARPESPPAATPTGATLYSVSSSMLVDIQRMEQDLAALKYKAYIVSNMRN